MGPFECLLMNVLSESADTYARDCVQAFELHNAQTHFLIEHWLEITETEKLLQPNRMRVDGWAKINDEKRMMQK